MGLDAFTSGDDKPKDDESKEQPTEDGSLSKEYLGTVVRSRALKYDLNISVDGQQLTGSAEDFGMLFALTCLDVEDAELDNFKHEP
jgi:hypothetical protein